MKKRLLSLALALAFCLSLVPGVTLTARAAETPAAMDNAVTLYADYGSGLEPLDTLYFEKSVTEQTVTVDRPITALRVVKGDCYELNLDQLTLDGVCPAGYERKLSATDNDLIEVEDSMDFALSGSGELVIAARAPVEVMGETCSFKFPQINRGPIVPGSFFYSYIPGTNPGSFADRDELTVPDGAYLFESTMCHPDSGHPDAPMDIYVADNGETLFVFFEAFIDNTFDHGKDFAGVHVKCGDTIKTYKVHTTEDNEYGRWWFGYTDSSDVYDWEHMCYVIEVPMADLETADGALELAFEYYGTAGYQGSQLLSVAIDGVLLVADAQAEGYWNNPHEYYPEAELLPAPGVTRNAAGGSTPTGDWWLTNNGGEFTLTLNGATLDEMSEATPQYSSYVNQFAPLYTLGNLTIELAEGTINTIACDDADNYYGIKAYCQELVIKGTGTLNVSEDYRPVYVNNLLTIKDGAQVNATLTGTHTNSSWGSSYTYTAVDVFGLTVDGAALTVAANVTVPDGSPDHVYVSGIEIGDTGYSLTVKNGAVVEASASGGNVSGGTGAISWYGDTVRLDLAGEPITIREGSEATTAEVKEQLTTEYVYYSTRSLPYVKLETTAPAYDLWVAGTRVTSANAGDLSKIEGVTLGEGGEASYNPETNTLTLKNASIDGAVDITNTILVPDSASELKIAFTGTNTITARNSFGYCRAVNALGADLVLSGGEEATLTIRANMSGGSAENGGLRVGSLTITGGTVTVECPAEKYGPAHNPYSISLNRNAADVLKVTGGKLISKGWEPLFYGPSAFTAERVDRNTYLRGTTNIEGTGLEPYDYTTNSDYSGGSYNSTYRYVEATADSVVPAAVTVFFEADGGEVSTESIEVTPGEPYGTLPEASKDGLVFDGWILCEGGGVRLIDRDYYSGDPLFRLATAEGDEAWDGHSSSNFRVGCTIVFDVTFRDTVPRALEINDRTVPATLYTIDGSRIYGRIEITNDFINGRHHFMDIVTRARSSDYTVDKFYVIDPNGTTVITADSTVEETENHALLAKWVEAVLFNVTVTDGTAEPAAAAAGETVTVTANDKNGYTFKGWQVVSGAAELADLGAVSTSFIMPAEDVELKAVFTKNSSGGGVWPAIYPIAAPVGENGTVTVSPAAASKGTTVTVTPKPDEGFEVDKVTVTDKDGNEIPVTDNGDGTYSFTMPSGKVTVNATFKEIDHSAACPSKDFKDVDPDVWYHEAVDYVVEKGLMVGIADDQFHPNGMTTRAMIVTILYRLEGEPAVSGTSPFDDVAADQWYTDAVIWASENGIVSGYGDGKFGPTDAITREQFATILYRYAQYKDYDVSVGEDTNVLSYNDAFDVSEWAMPAIQWACGTGLMQGDNQGNLLPGDSATRAQAATLIMRFIEVERT